MLRTKKIKEKKNMNYNTLNIPCISRQIFEAYSKNLASQVTNIVCEQVA